MIETGLIYRNPKPHLRSRQASFPALVLLPSGEMLASFAIGSGFEAPDLHTELARSRGLSVTGAALWRGSEFVATPDEEAFYRALGLPWIPPELREGRGEVAAGGRSELPRLVQREDLRGFLHCHTTYSDGSTTVEELALACRAAGYQYLGITDHSQAAAYAGGLSADDLARQAEEIDAVNARLTDFRCSRGSRPTSCRMDESTTMTPSSPGWIS